MRYRADLHIHTCLSPCAEEEMVPHAIVQTAGTLGLDIIGICDHNTAGNVGAVIQAARARGVHVIPGIEITTREEAHILGLFESEDDAMAMQRHLWRHLPGKNREAFFGEQALVDADGNTIGICDRLLAGATDLSVSEVVEEIHRYGGCAIAAHVDRERFGLISQLGFVPRDLPLEALEHSPRVSRTAALARFGENGRRELVCNSDAHRLGEIGTGSTLLDIEEPTVAEIQRALNRRDGRRVVDEDV